MINYKKDFPIFTNRPELVYLDSAATTQKPQIVIDSLVDYYQNYNANSHRGLYEIAEKTTEAVENVREKVRKLLNARNKEEIIFTKSTTEGINLVMQSWGKNNIVKEDTVAVPLSEHHANFIPWQQLSKEKSARFATFTSFEELASLGKLSNLKLLAFSHVSNVLGTISPVNEIIRKQKEIHPDIKILVDAAQSVAHGKIDVQQMDCDFLVFSGHKIFAETGVGVLYAKKELLEKMDPFLYGGNMIREVTNDHTIFADTPSRFEAGTLNIAGIISLGSAIDYIEAIGFKKLGNYEKKLIEYFTEMLQKIDGITILGNSKDTKRAAVISFIMDRVHPHDVAQILGDNNICIRAGHHCAMPLHTYLRISASARVSISIYNTEEDINKCIDGLKQIKKYFK